MVGAVLAAGDESSRSGRARSGDGVDDDVDVGSADTAGRARSGDDHHCGRSKRRDRLRPRHAERGRRGGSVAIAYGRDMPTVSVRVQDMFGTSTHPTIAHDVPLTIELLSPADRPIQITSDLAGFWARSWGG